MEKCPTQPEERRDKKGNYDHYRTYYGPRGSHQMHVAQPHGLLAEAEGSEDPGRPHNGATDKVAEKTPKEPAGRRVRDQTRPRCPESALSPENGRSNHSTDHDRSQEHHLAESLQTMVVLRLVERPGTDGSGRLRAFPGRLVLVIAPSDRPEPQQQPAYPESDGRSQGQSPRSRRSHREQRMHRDGLRIDQVPSDG